MDKEKILEKMRELKFNRENDFIEKNQDDNKVLDVKYLGIVDVNGEQKGIFLLTEQNKKENGSLIEVERYCTEDGEYLGGNNKSDAYNFVLLSKEHIDDKKLLENIENLNKEGLLDLNEIEEKRVAEIAKELGIKKEEIEKLAEIDANKKLNNKEEGFEKDKDGKEVLSAEKIEEISTKQEIDVNQKVTDSDTIGSVLNVEGKGYKKIAVVYTDKIKDSEDSTKFSFVGIKEDGTAEKIDTIEQRYGAAPTKTVNSLNRDGSKIEQEKMNSIYQVRGGEQLGIKIGPAGSIEMEYIRTPEQDNQEAISIPIETKSIKPTTREVREFANKARNPRVIEESKRIEKERELGCEPEKRQIDDNPYNDPHKHPEKEDKDNNAHEHPKLEELAREILDENEEIADVYNGSDVKAKLEETIKENEGITLEELIEKVEQEMEDSVKDERVPNSHEH